MGLNPVALYQCLQDDLALVIDRGYLHFLKNHGFPPGARPYEAAASSILRSFLKKYEVESTGTQDKAALLKFESVNQQCKLWNLQLATSRDEALYGEFKHSLYNFFTVNGYDLDVSLRACLEVGKCGPGASVMALGGDSYTKLFSSPISVTDRHLYYMYRRYVSNFPEWHTAELNRCMAYGEAYVVEGNRLSFVPKDDKISRIICVEPSLNMFYQLGLGEIISKRLKAHFGIDLSIQPTWNRRLARLGSMGFGFVTIDLSSASDSMSLSMLKSCLPSFLYRRLVSLRSPTYTLDHSQHELNMVSTMGNGFTFPLQTILFSCIVRAAFRMNDVPYINPSEKHAGNWGVFGDDIICPAKVSRDVFRLLQILGFTVNPDKTFVEGPFRESCGGDYFNGRNIRGVYVKRLRSVQDRFSVINQLNLFSARTGLYLGSTVRKLMASVPKIYVPRAANDDAGIKVPSNFVKGFPTSSDTGSILYRRFVSRDVKIRFDEDRVIMPRGHKLRIYNPSGLLIAFTEGWLRDGVITVRLDRVHYHLKRDTTPFWDWCPTIHSKEWFNWQRWETAVCLNLIR